MKPQKRRLYHRENVQLTFAQKTHRRDAIRILPPTRNANVHEKKNVYAGPEPWA